MSDQPIVKTKKHHHERKDKEVQEDPDIKCVSLKKVQDDPKPEVERRRHRDVQDDDEDDEDDDDEDEDDDEEEDEDDEDEDDDISITSSFVLKNDILHFVLSKFLLTQDEDKKNITTVLNEINASLKVLAAKKSKSSSH